MRMSVVIVERARRVEGKTNQIPGVHPQRRRAKNETRIERTGNVLFPSVQSNSANSIDQDQMKERDLSQEVKSNVNDNQADPEQDPDRVIENNDQTKIREDRSRRVQPKSQSNQTPTDDRRDHGQLTEEVPFEEMIKNVITVRDLEAEVQLDAQKM